MAIKKSETNKFYDRHRKLKAEIIVSLRKAIGNKTIDLEKEEISFFDEANNRIRKVDKDLVYFDGTMETYPIDDLGIEDALYILGNLEK